MEKRSPKRPGSAGSTGGSIRRGGRARPIRQQTARLDAAPPQASGPLARRQGGSSRPAARRGGGLLLLARLVAYGLLLFLAGRLAATAWQTVDARHEELRGRQAELESLFPRQPVLKGGLDRRPDSALATRIERALASSPGETAVYVKNLNSGAAASVDEDALFPSASLFKVPILVEVLRQESLGLFGMDTPVRLQQKHWAEGSGVLQAQIGKEFPVGRLLELMIGVSDNVAALALLDLVGTDSVNLTLQANGLEATRLRIGNPSRNWGGRPGQNTTTAREMGILLEKIATGGILREGPSEEAVRLLGQKQQVSWLPALLPAGVKVAHKSGEIPGVRHDAGIVYAPGNPFVAVVLISDLTNYDLAAQTIGRVARAAYDHFEAGRTR